MDVGCNTGEFIQICFNQVAGVIKTMYGFEPNPEIYEDVRKKFSEDPRVVIENVALGNKVEDRKLYIPGKLTEENGEKVWKQGAHVLASLHDRDIWHTWDDCTLGSTQVHVSTLDQFVADKGLEKIDYLKIDVEGNELAVLEGAEKTLDSGIIRGGQFEYGGTFEDANITLGQVVSFLNGHGYDVYDTPVLAGPGLTPDVKDDYTWSNIIFRKRKS
jgi:FkbM family methyltransferase